MSRGSIAIWMAPATLWLAASIGGQDPPVAPPAEKQEESKGGKKGADRMDGKAATVVRLNVEVKAEGAPLADAVVLVTQASGFQRQSSTNSAGVAHFSQAPRGKTTVQVTAA